VVVAVVSVELAHPEIKTAVSASAAKATSFVFIAIISNLARKADGLEQVNGLFSSRLAS
jgi:hypothetical protein